MPQLTTTPAQIVADTIVRTVELGVRITDAALAGETTLLWCELLVDRVGRCPGCGLAGVYRDSVERRVTDVPVVGHPLELRVQVPRYRCVHDGCDREVFCHDTDRLARAGWSTTRRCAAFVLRRLAVDKATVTAVARELGRSWDTVNTRRGRGHYRAAALRRPGPVGRRAGHWGRRAPLGPHPHRRGRRVRHCDH